MCSRQKIKRIPRNIHVMVLLDDDDTTEHKQEEDDRDDDLVVRPRRKRGDCCFCDGSFSTILPVLRLDDDTAVDDGILVV